MKRIIASILAVIYLSTSMGATVHLHYCMGHLVGWDLMGRESKDCIACGMTKERVATGCSVGMKDCCHDEQKHIQSDGAQKPVRDFVEWNPAPALITNFSAIWCGSAVVAQVIDHPVANGPPLWDSVPVFLRNCTFRI